MYYEGRSYNGFSHDEVTEKGCGKNDVMQFKSGLLTRGVLIDIARLKGAPYLEPGTPVYPEDIEAWEKYARVKVTSGDAVFIRTGRYKREAEKGVWNLVNDAAGPHASVARWLKSRDVALFGSDVANELKPSGVAGVTQPIHQLLLVSMGVPLFDNLDLELLSQQAYRRHRWEFMFMAAPLAVPGGTGSPLNPIATF